MRIRPMPSQVAMSMPSTSAGSATLTMHPHRVPSVVTAGSPDTGFRLVAARRQRHVTLAKCLDARPVDGASTMPPCSASSSATPARSTGEAAEPTTIGTPRERASMATWLAGCRLAVRCRRRLQSVARKRVGAMSSPIRMAPAGGTSPPRSGARSTRSRMSRRSAARARKYRRRMPRSRRSRASSAARHAASAAAPAAIAAKAGSVSASSSSIAIWNSRMSAASPFGCRDQRGKLGSVAASIAAFSAACASRRGARLGGVAARSPRRDRNSGPSAYPAEAGVPCQL